MYEAVMSTRPFCHDQDLALQDQDLSSQDEIKTKTFTADAYTLKSKQHAET
jgi:hypothetical protein